MLEIYLTLSLVIICSLTELSIRVLLSIAVNQEWPLFQLDIKNAFLNGYLEEVYMDIPQVSKNIVVKSMRRTEAQGVPGA